MQSLRGIFDDPGATGPLEAALVIRRTGSPIVTWTRKPVPLEVVDVMAATMIASIETFVEALGGPNPDSFIVEVDERLILITKCEGQTFLIVVAPRSVGEDALRRQGSKILSLVSAQIFSQASRPSSRIVRD